MALLNVEEEKKKFSERLREDFFTDDRSQNTEVDYPSQKEKRGTDAVIAFANSEAFDPILALR